MSKGAPEEIKQGGGLLRSSGVVGIMTMLSRVLGLVRDVVIASYFGASGSADAFFVAFKIPNFLRRLFAEGAFSQAFVPVLSEYQTKQDHDSVKQLVDRVAGTLGLILLVVTIIAVLASPLLTAIFAPGFYMGHSEKFELASEMLKITFPYLLLISLTAFAGAILNTYSRFAVPAFTPVLLNVCLIGAAVFLSPLFEEPVIALAWGVLVAGVVQLVFQFPFLMHLKLLPKPVFGWHDEGVQRILKLMLPALFGVSVAQINLLLDTVLASFLQTGSVSWLYYSDRLTELPLGIFGIAISTVILPSLARKHASRSAKEFAHTLDWAVRMILLIGLPSALALILLAEPLIITLFKYGVLTERDVAMSAMSLRAYSCGLLAFMLIKVLAPGYFSRQDMKTPVKIAVQAMVVNMVFNLMLIWNFQHVGLAMATALSAFLNAGLLLRGLIREGVFVWQPGWAVLLLRLFLALIALAAVIVWFSPASEVWMAGDVWMRVQQMLIVVVAGAGAYFAVLLITGLRMRHIRA